MATRAASIGSIHGDGEEDIKNSKWQEHLNQSEKRKEDGEHKVCDDMSGWLELKQRSVSLERTRKKSRQVEKQAKYPEGVSVGGRNRKS